MKRYVVDTQCLLWYIARDRRLPKTIKQAFDAARDGQAQILVPSIVLVEALFLMQRQRMAGNVVAELLSLPETPDGSIQVIPLDMAVVRAVQAFGPAAVPELADRIIAASAYATGLPLMTVDSEIINSGLVTVVG